MIIMFGPAGSGKSTQGNILAEAFGWRWLSVGQVLRSTGEYEEILKNGNLVDDDTVIALMQKEIEKSDAEGYNLILDGYPRNAYQAAWAAQHIEPEIEGAIILEVPEEELLARLGARGRTDDASPAVIKKRFQIYFDEIDQILQLLPHVPIRRVSGVGSVEEVSARLQSVVEELVPTARLQKDDVNGEEIEKSYGE